MIYGEHFKKEYNKVISKIDHELNSVLAMTAIALVFIDFVSFASAAGIYGESAHAHLLSTTMIFAALFAALLIAKQVSMYFIRVKIRGMLIEQKAAAIAETVIYKEHILAESHSVSA